MKWPPGLRRRFVDRNGGQRMDVLRTIMDESECVVSKVEKEEIDRVVNLIRKDRRIFVAGEGRSGFSAKGFAMRLMHLGYTVYVVGETITPALREGDLLVGVSGSGKSISVIDAARKAKEKKGVVIAVTSKKESPLAGYADQVLIIPGTVKGDTGESRGSIQLLSSLFDQSLHIVLDAVCLIISYRDDTANESATGAHW